MSNKLGNELRGSNVLTATSVPRLSGGFVPRETAEAVKVTAEDEAGRGDGRV